jgi:hypothetical protein
MNPIEEQNTVPNFTTENFKDNKLSKENELNATMTIKPSSPDELEIKNKGVTL